MPPLLPNIQSPQDLKGLSVPELNQLAAEIRQAICSVVAQRSAHFASNLGVVELTLALHSVFDFSYDRLIWDVGHQSYPHKLVTGRYPRFSTIRTRGGLMGYPNPEESIYDLFMTGHAGCSISSALGLRCGDDLLRVINEAAEDEPRRHVVAVIGDGSFTNGMAYEALNSLAETRENRVWSIDDIKFVNDAIRIMQSIITKRLQTNSLASSFASLEAVLDNVGSSIYVRDIATGILLFANRSFKKKEKFKTKEK